MPSKKKSPAYIARQARIKGHRAIVTLTKAMNKKGATQTQKAFSKKMIGELTKQIAGSYYGRAKLSQREKDAISMSVAKIQTLVDNTKILRGKQGLANFATQQMLNMASRRYTGADAALDAAANPSPYSREQVKLFYKSTQRIWQNKYGMTDTSTINRRIMNYFKTNSLEEAFNRAMSNPTVKAQLELIENTDKSGKVDLSDLSPEAQAFYKDTLAQDNEQESQSSPSYLREVVQFDPNVSWRMQVE